MWAPYDFLHVARQRWFHGGDVAGRIVYSVPLRRF